MKAAIVDSLGVALSSETSRDLSSFSEIAGSDFFSINGAELNDLSVATSLSCTFNLQEADCFQEVGLREDRDDNEDGDKRQQIFAGVARGSEVVLGQVSENEAIGIHKTKT
jgi:hypothetical protein